MVVRPILVMLLLLGVALALLAIVGLALTGFWRLARALPTDSSTTSAWIGFAGSIVGSLLTVFAAAVALYPSYRQVHEMQRASAVQAGQILRGRYKAAKDEMKIILKSVHVEELPKLLLLGPDDRDREKWLQNHPEVSERLRTVVLPRMEEVDSDLFDANFGIELPDLDRVPYVTALERLKSDLYSVLDGVPRANGVPGAPMEAEQWRAFVAETVRYANEEWPKAHIDYNNKINAAINLLKYQIMQADSDAVGRAAFDQFSQWQKQVDEMEGQK